MNAQLMDGTDGIVAKFTQLGQEPERRVCCGEHT